MSFTIVLDRIKYTHNLGSVFRAAGCFGAKRIVTVDDRLPQHLSERELRTDKAKVRRTLPFERLGIAEFEAEVKAVWNRDDHCMLTFTHDRSGNAPNLSGTEWHDDVHYYFVFGPEDGKAQERLWMMTDEPRTIPSLWPLNLAMAVNVAGAEIYGYKQDLYHRVPHSQVQGDE